MSSSAPSTEYDEVKQPAVQPSLSDSVVFVNDISRLRPVDTPVVLSSSTVMSSDVSDSAPAVNGSGSDPFGPPSDEWAAASSSSSSALSSSPSDDPFASSTVDSADIVSTSPDAFAAFPKPGHVEEHTADSGERKTKKKKKKRAQQPNAAVGDAAAATTSIEASTAPAAASGSEADGDGGLLMADSAEYLAMLEQRLERLKKKQEARIKAAAAKTTRRTTEFVSITTSGALNETEDEKGPLTEQKAAEQQQAAQSAAVHSHATAAPSAAATATGNPSALQPASARHRTQVGLHSAPFDEDEVASIMPTALPSAAAAGTVDERGELVEDEALMPSSDGDAVGVVADKTAYYENKNNLDDRDCSVM